MTDQILTNTLPPSPTSKESKNAVSLWATIASWVFVPLLMPLYGIILIFTLSILSYTTFMTKIVFISIIFGINVVLPMLLIYLLKLFGLVKDVGLNDRNERFVPYLITVVCLAGSSLFLALKGAPQWVWLFYLGGAAAGVVNMLINFKWKISAHAAGIAGVVAMMIRLSHVGTPQIDLLGWVVVWILLAGLLGASRIYLHRHTFLQVLGGYATGFLGVYLSMLFA